MFDPTLLHIINDHSRNPHYHKKFPIILFWSPKSGCTSLAKWFFYQIDLLQTALSYSPFIHNYEYDIYNSTPAYNVRLGIALREKQKETFKLVRNPYRRAVSSFVFLIAPPYIENPEWKPIRKFLYQDENSSKGLSFKQFLYYLFINDAQGNDMNPHFTQQYIAGEGEYVTNYIYLENFYQDMKALEKRFELKTAPINEFSTPWHHQSPAMIYKGNFSEADITDPLFPRYPTFECFYDTECIQLVQTIFQNDFNTYKYSREYLY
ncbi:sulfotransferase family 2 domain-containing protein [Bacillus paranthracis]|uniref:sulfotransferase family 2 domain-containing protein n=1 Tax=Bacillus TaxID=1386 RepID=UPI0006186BFC|nr:MULTISPECIES: sulfotransferase family 2 domain-containing protein [unclassified Bacillus (in: firmicutes)]MDU2394551.1 sulfotransferase family 2 domain-containing protein [Bacillus sp. (in: firmicutes)]OJD70782.1 glyoxalase [Bacillus sp. P14-1]